MRPVDQTLFGEKEGNCFQACIASIFELPLEEVPNFCVHTDWAMRFRDWLRKYGYEYLAVGGPEWPLWDDGESQCPKVFHLIVGPGPRGIDHAVVGFQGEMVFDPHPSRSGLVSVKTFEFIFPRVRGFGPGEPGGSDAKA